MKERNRAFLWAAFLVWTVWLLWMLLLGRMGEAFSTPLAKYAADHLGLIPFRTISGQLRLSLDGNLHAVANLGGNLLLFLPYGLFLPALLPSLRRYPTFLSVFLGGVFVVELCQLLMRVGFCEVDDLLLNGLGASAGFVVWRLVSKRR